jgi:hypothetical protein
VAGGFVIFALVLWVLPIFVAHSQGKAKNRAGVAYGLFLGWLGVIILALLPRRIDSSVYGECPWCKEDMRLDASACPHCQRDVTPAVAAS